MRNVYELRAIVPLVPGKGRMGRAQVAKVGAWKGHAAGEFELTQDDLKSIVETFERHKQPLQVDLGHDSAHEETEARGWIQNLAVDGDELWADIEWLDEMAEKISAGKFKFLSPVLVKGQPDPVSAEELGWFLESAGVTNKPFFRGMSPLMCSQYSLQSEKKTDILRVQNVQNAGGGMDREKLLKLLGLEGEVSDEQLIEVMRLQMQIDAVKSGGGAKKPEAKPDAAPTVRASQRFAMNLDAILQAVQTLSPDEVKALLAKLTEMAGGGAPQEAMAAMATQRDALATELQTLRLTLLDREIEEHVKSGQILDSERAEAKKWAMKDREAYEAIYVKRPKTVPTGRLVSIPGGATGTAGVDEDGLDEEERQAVSKIVLSAQHQGKAVDRKAIVKTFKEQSAKAKDIVVRASAGRMRMSSEGDR